MSVEYTQLGSTEDIAAPSPDSVVVMYRNTKPQPGVIQSYREGSRPEYKYYVLGCLYRDDKICAEISVCYKHTGYGIHVDTPMKHWKFSLEFMKWFVQLNLAQRPGRMSGHLVFDNVVKVLPEHNGMLLLSTFVSDKLRALELMLCCAASSMVYTGKADYAMLAATDPHRKIRSEWAEQVGLVKGPPMAGINNLGL